jgi:hypothetical protein
MIDWPIILWTFILGVVFGILLSAEYPNLTK